MRSAILFLLAGCALTSCQGPKQEGQKSIAPRAAEPLKKAEAPAVKPVPDPHANPHAAATPSGEVSPHGGSPGMGFMPDYNEGGEGMKVADVRPDGAAAKVGIMPGDIITKFANIPVGDVHDYMAALETVKVGDEIEIVLKRGTETKVLKGKVGISNR